MNMDINELGFAYDINNSNGNNSDNNSYSYNNDVLGYISDFDDVDVLSIFEINFSFLVST